MVLWFLYQVDIISMSWLIKSYSQFVILTTLVSVASLSWTVSHHVMALSDNSWVAQFILKPSGMFIYVIVFSTFLIHLPTISASYSPIYGSQPISLVLLTSHTSNIMMFVVAPFTGVVCGIFVAGVVCVVDSAMPSITAFTICTSHVSTYCRGTPVGIVDGCASAPSCYSTVIGGTSSVWLGP